ncbi:chromosome partitioning protein ParB, partial [Candidatus Wolfebacteria bacterium CG_4_10_14_0_8_um_filter_37_11]
MNDKKSFVNNAIFHIEIEKIKPNPFQPRKTFDEESLKELAASIREFGVIQPIIVTKIVHEIETGTQVEYQLIAGERRLMASKLIGLERIPAIIKRIVPSEGAVQMEMAIVENLQRSSLNPIETARAYAKLQDQFGLTQREVAAKLGKSRETIANAVRLLNLPTEIQDALADGKINESQGRLLLTIDDLSQQIAVFQDLLSNNLSVRELKNKIRRTTALTKEKMELPAENIAVDPEINDMQE